MKKTIVTSLFLSIFAFFIHSQHRIHTNEGHFIKRMEHTVYASQWNLDSKGDLEKKFFGDFNAWVEFFCEGGASSGFRILKDSAGTSFRIEVKFISNFPEARKKASEMYPSIGISASERSSISDDSLKQITKHNREAFAKQREEMFQLFKIESLKIPVSKRFAEKLHERLFYCIDNYKATRVADPDAVPVTTGGYFFTFRTVVDDAVIWSLNVLNPHGNDAEKMANLCQKIVADIRSKEFKESTYMDELSTKKD